MAKRKPSVYRKIRGISDADIRSAFQHLLQQVTLVKMQVEELRRLSNAMAYRVFPEKVAEFEAAQMAAKLAAEAPAVAEVKEGEVVVADAGSDITGLSDQQIDQIIADGEIRGTVRNVTCTSCNGFGKFEYTRADGEVFSELCDACQPPAAPDAIPAHGLGAVEDDAPDQ